MPNKQIGGSIPQVVRNPEGYGIKRLFFSQREIALIKDKTLAAGYGFIKAGTVLAENTSAAGNKGRMVPFVPPAADYLAANADHQIGLAMMVRDGATGHVYVSLADSYKFVVGDQLYYQNSTGAGTGDGLVDCGVITVIDRTTSTLYADITCGAYTATNATLAKKAYVYVKAGGTPFSIAKYIIDKDVDTGYGEEAAGALASIVLSNAILYTASLVNATATAITSLGAIQDGPHTILK
jgi:hypothetical protein